jgi:hypothetical protein
MIVYPAISPLAADRHAPEQVIGMAGLGDRHHPDSLIVFTGIRIMPSLARNLWLCSVSPDGLRYAEVGFKYPI